MLDLYEPAVNKHRIRLGAGQATQSASLRVFFAGWLRRMPPAISVSQRDALAIMPTYDYECSACHHKWELFQSIKAEPEKKCPACKKKKARRLIGAGAGLIFKGSGFYLTDY